MNFGTARKFGTDVAKRYGEGSEMLVVLGKRGKKTVQKAKTTAVAKYYGFERRTIFSTDRRVLCNRAISETLINQRAANGGSVPSWLNLAFLGRLDFPFRGPQTLEK